MDSQLNSRAWQRWLPVGAVAFALAGCGSPAISPAVSPTSEVVAFEEYRQANLDFVECVEEIGGVVTVYEFDNFGVPDLSNEVTWPDLDAEAPDYSEVLNTKLAAMEVCEGETVGPVRAAYFASGDRETASRETLDERWVTMLSSVIECFQQAGAELDDDATRPDLAAVYHDAADTTAYDRCVIDAGLATDLGGGFYQIVI